MVRDGSGPGQISGHRASPLRAKRIWGPGQAGPPRFCRDRARPGHGPLNLKKGSNRAGLARIRATTKNVFHGGERPQQNGMARVCSSLRARPWCYAGCCSIMRSLESVMQLHWSNLMTIGLMPTIWHRGELQYSKLSHLNGSR
jgi:hypothetical protein